MRSVLFGRKEKLAHELTQLVLDVAYAEDSGRYQNFVRCYLKLPTDVLVETLHVVKDLNSLRALGASQRTPRRKEGKS